MESSSLFNSELDILRGGGEEKGKGISVMMVLSCIMLSSIALTIGIFVINDGSLKPFFESGPTMGMCTGIVILLLIGLIYTTMQA